MSEEIKVDEALELAEKAQKKGTFDISKFAKGIGYPEDTVVAYMDIESAYKLNKINSEMSLIKTQDEDKFNKLEKEAEELSKKIIDSKVTFYMRGVNQEVIESVTSKCDKKYPKKLDALGQTIENQDWLREWTCGLVASNLVKIENAEGELDEKHFETEDVIELRKNLPREVFDLLVAKMQQLTLAGAYFKGLTDAGFLPKS
jgi:hypothetical protein